MKKLIGKEYAFAKRYMGESLEEALKSTCLRSKCGSVIIKDREIIGRGFNSPPRNLGNQRRCTIDKENYNKKVTDKTCCVHAEQRAITNALIENPSKIKGSTLYFSRLNEKGENAFSGKPYCTICSKMALDVGVESFVLWHKEGIISYDTEEYNDLSFQYKE